jgi:hypothetical protein
VHHLTARNTATNTETAPCTVAFFCLLMTFISLNLSVQFEFEKTNLRQISNVKNLKRKGVLLFS